MKVKCKSNTASSLPGYLRNRAYMMTYSSGNPSVGDGKTDLTIGKEYKVYGIRTSATYGDTEFFVVKDDMDLPWWMSEYFFEAPSGDIPKSWVSKEFDCDIWNYDPKTGMSTTPITDRYSYVAPLALLERPINEELIVDREAEGYEVFKRMRAETES